MTKTDLRTGLYAGSSRPSVRAGPVVRERQKEPCHTVWAWGLLYYRWIKLSCGKIAQIKPTRDLYGPEADSFEWETPGVLCAPKSGLKVT